MNQITKMVVGTPSIQPITYFMQILLTRYKQSSLQKGPVVLSQGFLLDFLRILPSIQVTVRASPFNRE